MNILVFANNFPPEVTPGATRMWEHCRRWVAAGHAVTVMTCTPHFPVGTPFEGYRNKLSQSETVEGVRVIRVWSWLAPNVGFAKRARNFVTYSMMAVIRGLVLPADVIFATSPQLFTPMGAAVLAGIRWKPWVMEVRDIWPESIVAVGMMSRGRLYRLLERIELALYRSAQKVIIVSEAFRQNFVARGVPTEKIRFVPNGTDNNFKPRERDRELEDQLGLKGKFVLGYIGTFGLAHGLDFILNCARELDGENVHFLLVGEGARRDHLIQRVRDENLTNVTIVDRVPRDEVPRYFSIIDGALINLKKSETFESVLPSKIFEAAAMGKPILLGVGGEARALVERYNAGRAFEPENREAFLSAVRALKAGENTEAYVAGGGKLAADYGRDTMAQRLLDILVELA